MEGLRSTWLVTMGKDFWILLVMQLCSFYRDKERNNVSEKAYSLVNVQNKYLLESLRQKLNPTLVSSNQPVLHFF